MQRNYLLMKTLKPSTYFFLFIIVLVAAFLRFWQLGSVPVGITHDELGYVYNSYSIAETGKNVFGESLPFLTWMNNQGWPFLPVPIYFSVPFLKVLGISAMAGRLPDAIIGVADVVLVFLLVKSLFKKSRLALLSALFLAISPWHVHLSRSAYDTNFALFFYLLGIVLFIFEIKKGRLPIFSLLSFFTAVFSYRGMNAIFLPIVFTLIWYGFKILKIKKQQLVVFLTGTSFIILFLAGVILVNGKAYLSEVSIFDNPKMQENIDTQIREAQGPILIRRLFINKPMYIINSFRENYLKSYSPDFLFLYTEPNEIYSIWSRGRVYFFDLILIIIGIAYLYKLRKDAAIFVTLMVLIGGLPGMIVGSPYSSRNFFISAFLPILSAGGAVFLLEYKNFFKSKSIIAIGLILIYVYLLGGYLFDYYGRYAFYGAEAWAKSLKDVSNLALENKNKYDKIIIENASFGDFIQYSFYAKLNPREVQKSWNLREKNKSNLILKTGNVEFISGCSDKFGTQEKVLYISTDLCHKMEVPTGLVKDYFGNTIWKIYY